MFFCKQFQIFKRFKLKQTLILARLSYSHFRKRLYALTSMKAINYVEFNKIKNRYKCFYANFVSNNFYYYYLQ